MTTELAQSFGLSETELLDEALKTFLQQKRQQLLAAQLEILLRYDVQTITELEARIRQGELPEHPTWEELITAENLTARLAELDGYLADL